MLLSCSQRGACLRESWEARPGKLANGQAPSQRSKSSSSSSIGTLLSSGGNRTQKSPRPLEDEGTKPHRGATTIRSACGSHRRTRETQAEPQPVRHHRVMGDKPSRGNGRVPKAATARGGFAAWLWGVIRAGAAAMLAANASLSGRCRPAEHLPVTAGRRSTGEIIAHGSRPQPWNSCVTQRPPKKAAWRAGRLACTSAKTAMRRGMGSHPAMPRRAPVQGDRTRSLL